MDHQPKTLQSRAWSSSSMLAGIGAMTNVAIKRELPDGKDELADVVEVGAATVVG